MSTRRVPITPSSLDNKPATPDTPCARILPNPTSPWLPDHSDSLSHPPLVWPQTGRHVRKGRQLNEDQIDAALRPMPDRTKFVPLLKPRGDVFERSGFDIGGQRGLPSARRSARHHIYQPGAGGGDRCRCVALGVASPSVIESRLWGASKE